MIKKIIIICFLLLNYTMADNFNDVKKLFTQKQYAVACSKSAKIYQKYKNDDNFLNIFAVSCLNSDMINRLILPIIKLYKTKEDRENAAYFSTILYQKKLLYHALSDGIDISYVNLPKTNYILSKIFDKFVKGEYNLKNGSYWFNDNKNSKIKYKLSIEERNNVKKMYLRTYINGRITKVRVYW